MRDIAVKMLLHDRAKSIGLLMGVAFTAFLVTFALSYFAGFMTRGFALIAENPSADIWVMDPAVSSVEQTINLPDSALERVRSVTGVVAAMPLGLASVEARLPNGAFQSFQLIGVDDATLSGAPVLTGRHPAHPLYLADSVIVDPGGTSGKLLTPARPQDQWPHDGVHLGVPLRLLRQGDELLVNERRVVVAGDSHTLPRFPPRPLMYTRFANLSRLQPGDARHLTFIMVTARAGVNRQQLANRITRRTGLRARTARDFKTDTVKWYLVNSEDVGDMSAMLILAMTVGFGVTGIMLYMFTYENVKQYAVFKALGASSVMLAGMVFIQAILCALLGTGLGVAACALVGKLAAALTAYPFRMMWFGPVIGALGVLIVSVTAAALSLRPVIRLDPAQVFAGR
ncbi:MAG: ABC transporter permease [Alcanivorax sp.]|nr:ABC transporter permease [Alcanivorax sp.]